MMWPSTSTTSVAISRFVVGADRHRDLVGADGGLLLEPAPALVVDVAHDDLDHAGGRDGEEGAEEAEQLDADQHADQHGQRVEVDGPGHDRDLEDVVLELLVGDEEDQRGDPGRHGVEEGDRDGGDGAEGGAHQRDEVGERHPQGQHLVERDADDHRKT